MSLEVMSSEETTPLTITCGHQRSSYCLVLKEESKAVVYLSLFSSLEVLAPQN